MVQISPHKPCMYLFDLVRTVPSRSTVIISCHQDFCDEFKIHDKEKILDITLTYIRQQLT